MTDIHYCNPQLNLLVMADLCDHLYSHYELMCYSTFNINILIYFLNLHFSYSVLLNLGQQEVVSLV